MTLTKTLRDEEYVTRGRQNRGGYFTPSRLISFRFVPGKDVSFRLSRGIALAGIFARHVERRGAFPDERLLAGDV